MQNPYQPSSQLDIFPRGTAPTKLGIVGRVVCWLLILTGMLLIVFSIAFIIGNGYSWLHRNQPNPVTALMLFVVISLGAIPATVGFALQHYSRRYLQWRTRNAPNA